MSGPFRLLFFFSSFGPLYAIFAIKLFYNEGVTEYVPWTFACLSMLALASFLYIKAKLPVTNGTAFEVSDIKAKDSEIFSYITTYIPPLISRDMSKPEVYLPLVVLYFIIGLAYMQLDSPYLNPFFILFGFRIYEGRMSESRNLVTIISYRRPVMGSGKMVLHEIGTSDLYYYGS